MLQLTEVVARYARGFFPMEEGWYAADPRAVFGLEPDSVAAVERRVRRSLRAGEGWSLKIDAAFSEVVASCARPRSLEDGVWLEPWIARQYEQLREAGMAHTFEIWDGERLAAGLIAVTLRRAAFLESMFHTVPHAGNVLVARTLERLAADGFTLCDIQTPTDHTQRLGAVQLTREEFERRLADALG